MKRGGPIKRNAWPKRKKKGLRIIGSKVTWPTKKRSGGAFPHRRDPEFKAFVRTLKCVICWKSPCDPCHLKNQGNGGDDIGNLVPMCRKHHDEQHNMGKLSFAAHYRVNLEAIALTIAEVYREWKDGRAAAGKGVFDDRLHDPGEVVGICGPAGDGLGDAGA